MQLKIINPDSDEYDQMITLRLQVLLNPIGIPASYINKEKEKEDILIGAFENGEILGCCVLTPREKNVIQLRQMAVKTHLQGRKIGATIVDFAEKIAKERGYTILMMHARDAVLEFYRKCGYTITGNQFFE